MRLAGLKRAARCQQACPLPSQRRVWRLPCPRKPPRCDVRCRARGVGDACGNCNPRPRQRTHTSPRGRRRPCRGQDRVEGTSRKAVARALRGHHPPDTRSHRATPARRPTPASRRKYLLSNALTQANLHREPLFGKSLTQTPPVLNFNKPARAVIPCRAGRIAVWKLRTESALNKAPDRPKMSRSMPTEAVARTMACANKTGAA